MSKTHAAFQGNYDYGYDRAGLMGVSIPDRSTYDALREAAANHGFGQRLRPNPAEVLRSE